jgi:hypothetical protein
MTKPCKDCFHFKTMEINKVNLIKYPFLGESLVIQKKLNEHAFVKVWFCKLKENLLTTKHWVDLQTDRNCTQGDFDDT